MGRKREEEVEEEEENDEVEGSFFYVNRDGFPIKEEIWERMYDFAAKNHPLGKLGRICSKEITAMVQQLVRTRRQ